jgi:branched-subunit amino acid transport protein
MTWPALLALWACVYATKAIGPVVLGDRQLPRRLAALLSLVAVPMFAGLIFVQTITSGDEFVVDSRLAGVAVAIVAVWRRAPFVVVVLLAAAAAAAAHALTT